MRVTVIGLSFIMLGLSLAISFGHTVAWYEAGGYNGGQEYLR